MDEIVLQGMAKWPNVPAAYGWLSLDRRGQWRLKGDVIRNPAIIAFIGRNYEHDDGGCWFFQNGPQRVYVELDQAPLVFRWTADDPPSLVDHIGRSPVSVDAAFLDDAGNVFLRTERGPGIIDDRDLERLASLIHGPGGHPLEDQDWEALLDGKAVFRSSEYTLRLGTHHVPVQPVAATRVPEILGFVPKPAP